MQNPKSPTILTRGTNLLAHLFSAPTGPLARPVPQTLPVQPAFQRRRFLDQAITEGRSVFTQLAPRTTAGAITNVTGRLSQLADGHYLIRSGSVTYFFSFNQLRYIAGA